MDKVEVIVLAQATMERVVDTLPAEEKRRPILSRPRLGVAATKEMMAAFNH